MPERDHRDRRFIVPLPQQAPSGKRWIRCGFCGSARLVVDGSVLREKRLDAGVGLREVARRLRFSAAYICDLEYGRRLTTPKVERFYENLARRKRVHR